MAHRQLERPIEIWLAPASPSAHVLRYGRTVTTPVRLEVLVHSDSTVATRKLIREELVLLRRLALDRRIASSRMASLWRTALLYRAAGGLGDPVTRADAPRRARPAS